MDGAVRQSRWSKVARSLPGLAVIEECAIDYARGAGLDRAARLRVYAGQVNSHLLAAHEVVMLSREAIRRRN